MGNNSRQEGSASALSFPSMPPKDTSPPVGVVIVAEPFAGEGDSNHNLPDNIAFTCGVAHSQGPRRFMEDSHTLIAPFGQINGQGFFAVFDGHAGKHAAEWCGQHFHEFLEKGLKANPSLTIPDILNLTFHDVDAYLSKLAEDTEGKMHSGCTAVTAFLRIEDADGKQSFLNNVEEVLVADTSSVVQPSPVSSSFDGIDDSGIESNEEEKDNKSKRRRSKLKSALKHLSGSHSSPSTRSHSPVRGLTSSLKAITPSFSHLRRVLYCANAGDARGVLCRGGKAVRLTYDHKGSDKQEAKRITDAGGFVMSGRVNGVLAVTRSLGDSSMKEFVVGSPYTTETELYEEDEFVILACDGLWDVAEDHEAVEYVRYMKNPNEAVDELVKYAKQRYSNDNVTVVVVRFRDPPEQ